MMYEDTLYQILGPCVPELFILTSNNSPSPRGGGGRYFPSTTSQEPFNWEGLKLSLPTREAVVPLLNLGPSGYKLKKPRAVDLPCTPSETAFSR